MKKEISDEKIQQSGLLRGNARYKRTMDLATINSVIKSKLIGQKLKVKIPSINEKFAQILSTTENGLVIRFINFIPPQGQVKLTTFIQKHYAELGVSAIQPIKEDLHFCSIKFLRIASCKRMENRIPIDDDKTIYAKRLKFSKKKIDFSQNNLPTSFKILLEKFQEVKRDLGDRVVISGFQDTAEAIYEHIYQTRKSVFVKNCTNADSFTEYADTDEIVDLKKFYGSEFDSVQEKMEAEKKIGWIISPILDLDKKGNWKPLGYIECSYQRPIEIENLMEVKTTNLEILEKFQKLNVEVIPEKFRIVDVSNSGICFEITDPVIMDTIINISRILIDIIIKGQPPITILGVIRSTKMDGNGNLYVGLQIRGETSREDQMSRYQSFIKELVKNRRI